MDEPSMRPRVLIGGGLGSEWCTCSGDPRRRSGPAPCHAEARMSSSRVPDFSRAHVLVFGDVMLDEYVVGEVSRISPEAPIPVFLFRSKYQVPGGASNVAANVAALGARVTLCGVAGGDESGERLSAAIAAHSPGVRF